MLKPKENRATKAKRKNPAFPCRQELLMRFFTFIFTGFLFMSTATSVFASEQNDRTSDRTAIVKLSNGLTVLVKQDRRFPLVSLRLYVHAGSTYESPQEAGISHMLEHMVFKGTQKRPKGQVAVDVERTGGYLNAATSFDYTVYLTDMTSDYWKTGMDVLKDMAFHPTLDPEELESEKDVVIAELKRGEDSPGQRLFRKTQQMALKGTPYQAPIIGYESTVRSLTTDSMRAYIRRLYQPQAMLLVICGDVNVEEAVTEAVRQFGDLENTHPIVPPSDRIATLQSGGFSLSVEEGPWNKVHLSLVLPVPGMNDIRSSQLDVLAQVLGGDATSRFYREYKYEKRLVDSISVSNYSFERLGLLYIQATLDADKLPAFWEAFSNELSGLAGTTFSSDELNRARLNLEDELFRSKETLSGLASKIGYFALLGEGEQGEANYLRTVKETDQQVLLDLIQSVFTPDALTLTVLMPEKATLAEQLPKGRETGAGTWSDWLRGTLAAKWPSSPARDASEENAGMVGAPEIIELGKGRTVVLTPDTTLPYTAVNLVFTGGNTLLAEKDQGLGAFTASLLTKGTAKLSATAWEDYLADRAASFSANSGRQTFSLSMDAPARFTDDMFGLLQATLTSPAMKEEEAGRGRDNQTASITMSEDQPTSLAFRRMFPFLFGNHPYGYLQLGEKERVAEFTAAEASAFWKNQARQPWVLSVCGTYDKEAILAAAGQLPVPAKKESPLSGPAWGGEKELNLHLPGRNQGHLFMIFPTVPYGHPDEAGIALLQNILAGQSGLLFSDLRDKQGLGYTVTAFPWKSAKTGMLVFYIGTEPEKMQQAEKGFLRVIGNLQSNLLDEEELVRGKNQMSGDYYRDHQSLSSRSAEAAILTVLRQPLDAPRVLVDMAGKLKPSQIQELVRTYLQADKAYIVKVLP